MKWSFVLSVVICIARFASSASAQPRDRDHGEDAIRNYGCQFCHEVPGVTATASQSCTGCHQRILSNARASTARTQSVRHYVQVPSLRFVTRRLRDDYLVAYLQNPHDARPRLEESMPQLLVTEAGARAIVAYLKRNAGEAQVATSPAPASSNIERGRQAFVNAGCGTCHTFGNADTGFRLPPETIRALGAAAQLAPNLRFVRDRMTPDVALAWIQNPQALDPNTRMPKPAITGDDAIAIRDYLFLATPGQPASPRAPLSYTQITPLERAVHFPEVRRIFGQSCIHCHAHSTGAGATSALGFAPISLDLATYEGVQRGVTRANGTTESILARRENAPPILLERLLQRHAETSRDLVRENEDSLTSPFAVHPESRARIGMPLGLPPLSLRDLQVLRTWIEQGAPR